MSGDGERALSPLFNCDVVGVAAAILRDQERVVVWCCGWVVRGGVQLARAVLFGGFAAPMLSSFGIRDPRKAVP